MDYYMGAQKGDEKKAKAWWVLYYKEYWPLRFTILKK